MNPFPGVGREDESNAPKVMGTHEFLDDRSPPGLSFKKSSDLVEQLAALTGT